MDQSQSESQIYQIITKLINGKSQTLNFKTPIIPISQIKSQIQTLTSIPIHHQLLVSNGKTLHDDVVLHHETNSPTLHLLLRLRGGKGGFGSLLRGAATKAGQKKTNNFDACRDMSGRRLRHVNAEKKMEEWLAEEKERKLEKVAEDFIKKQSKKAGGGSGNGDGAEKYVEKYRNDSRKCMEDVEKSVRESLSSGFLKSKRKVEEGNGSVSKSKKLKIWMGKRKVDDSDSDDMGEEDSDDDDMGEENEKSGVTDNENRSDSNKDVDGSVASVNGGKVEGESSVGCSSESASEEEKETVAEEHLGSVKESKDEVPLHKEVDAPVVHEESVMNNLNDSVPLEMEKFTKPEFNDSEQKRCKLLSISDGQEAGTNDVEAENSDSKVVNDEEKVSTKSDCPEPEKPLNFDEFNSAAEMEVLGMERLKSELQERGLKCGGTLQERAARLFLLKTTPLEMLPKKLLAKK